MNPIKNDKSPHTQTHKPTNPPTHSLDIKSYLDQDEEKDLLRLLTAGSVDDGKSTLIGRLLFDSKRLYEDQLAALERDSKRVGHAGEEIDYALLLDGLKAEREQGITIDVAYRYFSTNKRKFIIADTPGHEQYTRNMVTGASTANLAILLVDAKNGMTTQTKRHTFIVSLLGIKHVILAVNKMDLVDYDEARYHEICKEYRDFVIRLNIPDLHFIPMCALKGDNVVDKTENLSWYNGPTMLNLLENIQVSSDNNFIDLRYPVQYVLRPDNDFRGFSARVASGIIRKNDEIMVLPSRKKSRIKKIVTYETELDYAFPPQSVTVTLEDEIDVSRGDMLVHPNNLPKVERKFEVMLVWMDEQPMDVDKQFLLKHTSNITKARLDKIRYKLDVNTLHKQDADLLHLNEIGRTVITTARPIYFDPYRKNKSTGSLILIDPITHNTSAVGMIIDRVSQEDMPSRITDIERERIQADKSLISRVQRERKYGQKGATIWITGLHGSGKKELAYALEKELFSGDHKTVLLDGSSIRSGLSRELDFTAADRAEHLRRVAEVSRMLNDQGLITICSFISPGENIRQQIKTIIGADRFQLIYMNADLDYCRRNSSSNLYDKAEKGELKHIPGFDLQYDIPKDPTLTVDPQKLEDNVQAVLAVLREKRVILD
jgi:bifunctional enzyme CysN/CysC